MNAYTVTMTDNELYWVDAPSISEAMATANHIAAYWGRAHRALSVE